MITEDLGGNKVERYNSMEEIPSKRWMLFNRYVIQESGIGSSPDKIDEHDKKIIMYAKRGDFKKIIDQTENRNKAMHWILENRDPGTLAHACLIRSINGIPQNDLSEDGLKSLAERVGGFGVKIGILRMIVDQVKKNFEKEIDIALPGKFDSGSLIESFVRRKERVLAKLEILKDRATDERLKIIELADEYLMNLIKPTNYSGKNGADIKYVKSYEEMSFILSQHTSLNVEEMPAMKYLLSWEIIKKQNKPDKKKKGH